MAKAALATITPCPAARLAHEAARVLLAKERFELKDRDAFAALEDRLDAIEDACSYERATSPLGAFFQAVLLHVELDPASTLRGGGRRVERHLRRLRRLTASIASNVEAEADREVVEVLRASYFARDLDDLALLDGYLAVPLH